MVTTEVVSVLSCRWLRVQSLSPRDFHIPHTSRVTKRSMHRVVCSLLRFPSLRRLRTLAATFAGFTSPDSATPAGFLNLLTSFSASTFPALFHASNALGLSAFRDFPLPLPDVFHNPSSPSCCCDRSSTSCCQPAFSAAPQLQGCQLLGGPFAARSVLPGPCRPCLS